MGRFASIKSISKKNFKEETIRISKSSKSINGIFMAINFRDKDTRQIIVYIPSLQISGYGSTKSKAMDMLRFSIDDLFEHFINLPLRQLTHELSKLGWKHDRIKNKIFSQAYVDVEGNLKEFNAVNDEVKTEVLSV